MEKALELLDFMNFRLENIEQFKAKAAEKLFSLEAHGRMMNLKTDIVRRTRQLVEEWMKVKGIEKYEYGFECDNHTYKMDEKPGRLQVMIKNDPKSPDLFVARTAGWTPDGGANADLQLRLSSLEHLLGSFNRWADKRFQAPEIVKEVKYYFNQLVFKDKPPYSFVGWLSYNNRSGGTHIRMDLGTPMSLYVELKNERK